jgi:hypothetical protein
MVDMIHIGPIVRSVRRDLKRVYYIGPCNHTVASDLWDELEWVLMERILNRVWYQTKYYGMDYTFNPDDPKNHERLT